MSRIKPDPGEAPRRNRLARLARPIGHLVLAAFVLVVLIAIILAVATGSLTIQTLIQIVSFAAFALVGTILLEQAAHPIGWICLAIGFVPLTAALGGLYAASVALFQRLFVVVTGDRSDGAIVITTLILAALFTPARKSLESAVDRRFRPAAPVPQPAGEGAPVAIDDPALERRIAEVARAVVREALADRGTLHHGTRSRRTRGD